MRTIFFIACTLFLIIACSKSNVQGGEVILRVSNSSSSLFDSVIVNSPGGKQVYYNVAAGSSSVYKSFSFLYNYAYIEVHFNNQMLKLQPYDYVGEEKLNSGKYSYKLGIAGNQLALECKRD